MTKKIVEYHIARLKDKRVAVRLEAIHELTLLNDVDSLEALREVFENDDDLEVRKAAQDAGREIFKRNHLNQNATTE